MDCLWYYTVIHCTRLSPEYLANNLAAAIAYVIIVPAHNLVAYFLWAACSIAAVPLSVSRTVHFLLTLSAMHCYVLYNVYMYGYVLYNVYMCPAVILTVP